MTLKQVSNKGGWLTTGLVGWLAVSALGQATQPAVRDPLGKAGKVAGVTDKKISGGTTVGTGWQGTSASSQIRIALANPIGPKDKAVVELDFTNWDPKNQYKTDKQQFFALLSQSNGDPSDGNTWEASKAKSCYAMIRGGTNYIGYAGKGKGVGFKSFVAAKPTHRLETAHYIDRNDWSKTKTYTFRFEIDESRIRMFLDGSRFQDQGFKDRQANLGFVYIGKDNWTGTKSALVGPVFQELRVYGGSGSPVSVYRPSDWTLAPRRTRDAAVPGYDLIGRYGDPSLHRTPSLQLYAHPTSR